jgi:GNAT superfamily N-acetyltransferase
VVTDWHVRPAQPHDADRIALLVRELASFQGVPDEVEATSDDFAAALFASDPRVHCLVAEVSHDDGSVEVVGMALWFVTFSTWKGRHGIWLEDLFVLPDYRRLGLGRALIEALAAECVARGYARLEWMVLDSNESAPGFYRSLGASVHDELRLWRLDGQDLYRLGSTARLEGSRSVDSSAASRRGSSTTPTAAGGGSASPPLTRGA